MAVEDVKAERPTRYPLDGARSPYRADGWCSPLGHHLVKAEPDARKRDGPAYGRQYEHVLYLSKSARYFYDADAIREDGKDWSRSGPGTGILETQHYGANNGGNAGLSSLAQRYKDGEQSAGRNKRNVWEIATQPYAEAHFATFPPKLVEPLRTGRDEYAERAGPSYSIRSAELEPSASSASGTDATSSESS